MITPLRRRHRWLAPGSFAFALVGLAVALIARPTEFVERAHAGRAVRGALPARATVLADREGYTLATTDEPQPRLWLVPRVALDAPDLLVYRAPTDTASMDDTEQLPSGAKLLGAASPTDSTSFPWTPGPCVLVLYSLGHSRRFDTVQVRDAGAGASPTQERR